MSTTLRATASVSETRRLRLQLAQRAKVDLQTYARLQVQQKALEAELALLKAGLEKRYDMVDPLLLDEGVDLGDGYRLKRVSGHTSRFDKKLFVRLGGDLETYEAAKKIIDKAPYLLITVPGEQSAQEESDE